MNMKEYAEILYIIDSRGFFYMCQVRVFIIKYRPYLLDTFNNCYDKLRNYCCICRGVKDAIC